jgi:hypothetical protein
MKIPGNMKTPPLSTMQKKIVEKPHSAQCLSLADPKLFFRIWIRLCRYFQIQGSDPDLDQTGFQKGIV